MVVVVAELEEPIAVGGEVLLVGRAAGVADEVAVKGRTVRKAPDK